MQRTEVLEIGMNVGRNFLRLREIEDFVEHKQRQG